MLILGGTPYISIRPCAITPSLIMCSSRGKSAGYFGWGRWWWGSGWRSGAGEKQKKSSVAAKYGGGDNVVTSEPSRASAIVHMQQGIYMIAWYSPKCHISGAGLCHDARVQGLLCPAPVAAIIPHFNIFKDLLSTICIMPPISDITVRK